MRFLKMFLMAFLLTVLSTVVVADTNSDFNGAEFAFNHGYGWQKYQLGTKVIRDQVHNVKFQYNFASTGGAIGTQNLLYPVSPGGPAGSTSGANAFAVIPKNAIITSCYIDTVTAPLSGGSATLALSTGQSANDLIAATGKASFTGIIACIPTGSAATAIKMTSDRIPTITIATAALTAGKINLHIGYVMSDP